MNAHDEERGRPGVAPVSRWRRGAAVTVMFLLAAVGVGSAMTSVHSGRLTGSFLAGGLTAVVGLVATFVARRWQLARPAGSALAPGRHNTALTVVYVVAGGAFVAGITAGGQVAQVFLVLYTLLLFVLFIFGLDVSANGAARVSSGRIAGAILGVLVGASLLVGVAHGGTAARVISDLVQVVFFALLGAAFVRSRQASRAARAAETEDCRVRGAAGAPCP